MLISGYSLLKSVVVHLLLLSIQSPRPTCCVLFPSRRYLIGDAAHPNKTEEAGRRRSHFQTLQRRFFSKQAKETSTKLADRMFFDVCSTLQFLERTLSEQIKRSDENKAQRPRAFDNRTDDAWNNTDEMVKWIKSYKGQRFIKHVLVTSNVTNPSVIRKMRSIVTDKLIQSIALVDKAGAYRSPHRGTNNAISTTPCLSSNFELSNLDHDSLLRSLRPKKHKTRRCEQGSACHDGELAQGRRRSLVTNGRRRMKIKGLRFKHDLNRSTTSSPYTNLIVTSKAASDANALSVRNRCKRPMMVGDGICECQSAVSMKYRYPCYECTCRNLDSMDDIPDLIRENVFKLTVINATGPSLTTGVNSQHKPASKYLDFINLQNLHVINGRSLETLQRSDLVGMPNINVLEIRFCDSLAEIEPDLFYGATQIESLMIADCPKLTRLRLNNLDRTSMRHITSSKNGLQCGCDMQVLVNGSISNRHQYEVVTSVDHCFFRGLAFPTSYSACSRCADEEQACGNYSSGCQEVNYGAYWCSADDRADQDGPVCLADNSESLSRRQGAMLTAGSCECAIDKCICTGIRSLHRLNRSLVEDVSVLKIRNSSLNRISHSQLCHLVYLHQLIIEDSKLEQIDDNAFQGNRILTNLRISRCRTDNKINNNNNNNQGLVISKNAFRNSIINTISIIRTKIASSSLANLEVLGEHLSTLELIKSEITHLPAIYNVTKLRTLKLGGNSIQRLSSSSFSRLGYLDLLDLDGNMLECSCEHEWLHKSIQASKQMGSKQRLRVVNAVCRLSDNMIVDLGLHNPCGICSAVQCAEDEYCRESMDGISFCLSYNISDTAMDCNASSYRVIPSPYKCDQFTVCGAEGVKIWMTCPPGLLFNDDQAKCMAESSVHCGEKKRPVYKANPESTPSLSGFECPVSISGWDYHSFNHRLWELWLDLPNQSESALFSTAIEFIEYYGIYRHDHSDCQGYHRCHYDNNTGDLAHSEHYRCSPGTVFSTQIDRCQETTLEFMTTNPDQTMQCRCNLMLFQQRYVLNYREQYQQDPDIIPYSNEIFENDPCAAVGI